MIEIAARRLRVQNRLSSLLARPSKITQSHRYLSLLSSYSHAVPFRSVRPFPLARCSPVVRSSTISLPGHVPMAAASQYGIRPLRDHHCHCQTKLRPRSLGPFFFLPRVPLFLSGMLGSGVWIPPFLPKKAEMHATMQAVRHYLQYGKMESRALSRWPQLFFLNAIRPPPPPLVKECGLLY